MSEDIVMDLENSTPENVRVFVRVRPFNDLEQNSGIQNVLDVNQDNNSIIIKPNQMKNVIKKNFSYSKVFSESSNQFDVYRSVAIPIVEKIFEGYNGTIFAYGQSGTGKTYTMFGNTLEQDHRGIIPNIFSHMFSEISKSNKNMSYLVTVTYMEIYNEQVRDLLSDNPHNKLTIRERADVGVYVKDLLGFSVNSMDAVNDLLIRGCKNRSIGSTKLNDLSSRSHAIVTVILESKNKTTNEVKFGKLNLVDLAGSERVSKTMVTGERLREAGKINLSLSVLGNVISALVDQNSTHIPYRNSKLTRLLQDSLGGNSLTSVIAMVSPSELDCDETVNTLMYVDRVKRIRNYVSVNIEKTSVLKQFETKIRELESQLNLLNDNQESNQEKKKKFATKSKEKLYNEQLLQIEYAKEDLLTKINNIQKKILVGGENLLQKAASQNYLLESTSKELQSLDNSQKHLEHTLLKKEVEIDITKRKFSSLQEEDKELDNEIENVEQILETEIEVLTKNENAYQQQICALLYDNKDYSKQMKMMKLFTENFIPKPFLAKILDNLYWDDNSGDWKLRCVAHAGNNLKKRPKYKFKKDYRTGEIDKDVFFMYEKELIKYANTY
ncbi:kinesin-II 85 kDa subunit-like [Aethina tumida]|uniref:kinesin-II 85 kDa subunit-like n=1 Tax=Aethina tumida TaxID=116153 RepID=UPI002148F73E|nr:kinesin-II 85 kDa subunit-like [Aethina tumida]